MKAAVFENILRQIDHGDSAELTVKVGEKIVLKGAASGGAKGYKYAFYYKKSKNSTWTEMKPAYTTKSAAFKPGSATSYDVKSVVKDASGKTTKKVFTVKVTK